MHSHTDFGYPSPALNLACRCCGSHELNCCPGTKEMRWDGSAKVWEVFVIDTNEWLGAYDTRHEALEVVRA